MGDSMLPRPAVFLDRDGVVNKEKGPITCIEQLELYPGAAEAIASFNRAGWLCIVVTNQSAVARGIMTEERLAAIHHLLEERLLTINAHLDAIYHCPHLPPAEGEEEIPPYRIKCACRKPATGMIEKATGCFNIDIHNSFVIGDREMDVVMGSHAGLSTILLRTGYGVKSYLGESGIEPDFVFDDLPEAAEFLLGLRWDFTPLVEAVVTKYREAGKKRLMVLVGGQSRSGKSILVRYLEKEMGKRAIQSTAVRLDYWILPLDQRQAAKSVLDRYPASTIRRDLSALLAGDTVRIQAYDSKTRGLKRREMALSLPKRGVIFIEGVVALEHEYLRQVGDMSIFVDIEKDTHRKRFVKHYLDKGLTDDAINSLYAERMQDEYPFIEGSRKYADFIVKKCP
ncbi:MAG: HAD-IIIA family hydrolase [Bacillota bacterium]